MIDSIVKRHVFSMYGAQAVALGCNFAFAALLTRYGGIGTFGAYALLLAVSNIVINLATFRTNEAVIAFYGRGKAANDPNAMKFSLAAGVILEIFAALVSASALLLLAPKIAGSVMHDASHLTDIQYFAAYVGLMFLKSTPIAYLQATEKFALANAVAAGEQLLKLTALAVAILLHLDVTLRLAVYVSLLSIAVAVGALYLFLLFGWRNLRHGALSFTREKVREYWSFSLQTFTSSTLKAGNQQLDVLVLGWLTQPVTVGVYALLRQFVGPLLFISAPFSSVLYPRFVAAVHDHKPEAVRAAVSAAGSLLGRAYCLIVPGLMLALFVYTHVAAVTLEPSHYIVAVIMLVSGILGALQWWARPFSNAVNPKLSVVANACASVFLIMTLLPLTYFLGLLGTATAMCLLSLGTTAFWRRQLHRYA